MMTLRQLRYFLAVARHRHFGRAAEACHVSQPALSAQIRDLEAAMRGALLERRRSGITLTALGEEVERRAIRILGEADDLLAAARARGGQLAGPLRLGVIPTIAPYVLPRALPDLVRRYPALDLTLQESQTHVLVDALRIGALDVALMSLPAGDGQLEERALFDDPFCLARPASAPVAPGGGAWPLLLLEEGHCLRDQALDYCALANLGVRRSYGAASLATIVQMVANGYGATLLPQMAASTDVRGNPSVVLEPLPAPAPVRSIGLVWRKTSPRRADFEALGQSIITARPQV